MSVTCVRVWCRLHVPVTVFVWGSRGPPGPHGGGGCKLHASLASSSNQIARPPWSLSPESQLSSSLPLPSIPFSRGLPMGVLPPPLLGSPVPSALSSQRGLSKPHILPHRPLLPVQTPGLGFHQLSRSGPGCWLQPQVPSPNSHRNALAPRTRRVASHLWAFAQAAASARNAPHSFVAWLTPTHPLRPKAGITSPGKSSLILFSILGQVPGSGLLIPYLGGRSK